MHNLTQYICFLCMIYSQQVIFNICQDTWGAGYSYTVNYVMGDSQHIILIIFEVALEVDSQQSEILCRLGVDCSQNEILYHRVLIALGVLRSVHMLNGLLMGYHVIPLVIGCSQQIKLFIGRRVVQKLPIHQMYTQVFIAVQCFDDHTRSGYKTIQSCCHRIVSQYVQHHIRSRDYQYCTSNYNPKSSSVLVIKLDQDTR